MIIGTLPLLVLRKPDNGFSFYWGTAEEYAATKVPVMFGGKRIGHWYTMPNGECRYFSNKLYVDPFRKSA